MKRKILNKNKTISLFLLIQFFSCSSDTKQYGYLATKVKFPEKNNFSIKVIPPNTQIILVQIKGYGLNTPITFELTQDLNSRIIDRVPEGKKNIFARAIDINSNVLASGMNNVEIIPNLLNKVEISLEENKDKKLIKEPCVLFLNNNDLPISEVKEKIIKNAGCEIIYPNNKTSNSNTSNEPPVNSSIKPIPTIITPSPILTTKPCTVFIDPGDVPLSPIKEKLIKDAGCQIVMPSIQPFTSPIPTTLVTASPSPFITSVPTSIPTPTSTPTNIQSGGGGVSVSNPAPQPTSSVRVDINVVDGSPLPDNVTITDGN